MNKDNLLKFRILVAFFIFLSCGLVHLYISQYAIILYSNVLKPDQLQVFSFLYIATGLAIVFGSVMSFVCAYFEYKKEIDVWIISLITSIYLLILGIGESFLIPRNPFSWILLGLASMLLINDILIKIAMIKKQIHPKIKKKKS
jgi:hypothetical protein